MAGLLLAFSGVFAWGLLSIVRGLAAIRRFSGG